MDVSIIFFLIVGLVAGLLLGTWLRLGAPIVAGELIVDTHDWEVDKYKIEINRIPLEELTEHQYVSLKITQAIIADPRDINNDFNDTN